MTIREYLGLDSYDKDKEGKEMTHEDKYIKLVTSMGYEEVKKCLPTPHTRIIEALDHGDEYLNSIGIGTWDSCAQRLDSLYRKLGITCISLAERVCTLKRCAHMMYKKRNLTEIVGVVRQDEFGTWTFETIVDCKPAVLGSSEIDSHIPSAINEVLELYDYGQIESGQRVKLSIQLY
jgi:hypothetical protein